MQGFALYRRKFEAAVETDTYFCLASTLGTNGLDGNLEIDQKLPRRCSEIKEMAG